MLKKYITNDKIRTIVEYGLTIAAAFVLYFFMQAFIVKVAVISGTSMEPTFEHGERVMIARFVYLIGEPDYGDVVAFPYAADTRQVFVKRVIGKAGDVIDFDNNQFTVNGVRLSDDFSDEPVASAGNAAFPLTVEEGTYFVLGDNRNGSKDSRYSDVGCIDKKDILGKISVRIWPMNKIGVSF